MIRSLIWEAIGLKIKRETTGINETVSVVREGGVVCRKTKVQIKRGAVATHELENSKFKFAKLRFVPIEGKYEINTRLPAIKHIMACNVHL